MTIPTLDSTGVLPPGVWDCALDDVAARFVFNDHRRALWAGFCDFLRLEYAPSDLRCPIWIDGSFTRDKALPSDIDAVLDLYALPAATAWPIAVSWRMRHDDMKERYHIDLWPRHPELPGDLAAFFQYVGPKCAAELRLPERFPKGILRVRP